MNKNMFEKIKFSKIEEQKVDPKMLWEKLTTQPETSGALRKTLSGDNVNEYMKIMTSPEAVEAGWLLLCGDLTEEQAKQYMDATGNYYFCFQKLTNLAIKISQEFGPHLVDFVEKDVRGEKKEGMFNFLQSLLKLSIVRFEPLKNLHTGAERLSDSFMLQAMALIGSDLIDISKDNKTEASVKNKIREIIEHYEEVFLKISKTDFPGIYFNREKTAVKRTFEKRENIESLDRTIGFAGEYSFEERLKIIQENENFSSDIKKEALYKKIPLVTLNDEKPQIIAMRNDPDSINRYAHLAAIRINFGEKKIDFPPLEKDAAGNVLCEYGILSDIVNFNINPETGDLYFMSSGVSLNQVVSPDRYLALQNFILFKIKDYLENKEPDIEDLFVYSPSELEKQEKITETKGEELEQFEKMPSDLVRSIEEKIETETNQGMAGIPSEESLGAKFILPKNIRTMMMNKISGARSEEILAAFRRMLGKEEKIEGSHYFFRSERNRMILPVPLHSQKNKHHISLPLILNNLKTWQYDPIELAVELGLKIPKRLLMSK